MAPTLEELKGDQTAGAYRKGKLGTWPGETHKGEIMKALHAKRMQTYGKTGVVKAAREVRRTLQSPPLTRDAGGPWREGKKKGRLERH